MTIPLYQIDAFAAHIFEGNPAAVCPLETWMDDTMMQWIAAENNLAETAFFVKEAQGYRIRWFTPTTEVDLCGHATLAAAHVLFKHLGYRGESITFDSRSGPLHITSKGAYLALDFPSEPPLAVPVPPEIVTAFEKPPVEVLKGSDYIVVFPDGEDLTKLTPDYAALRALDLRGVCITARNERYDFVSRFFAPNFGIDEDPVTGSAHTQLTPYWAKRLGKRTLHARQVSPRGGELRCELAGTRVIISGRAVTYLTGSISL
ncbi:PhzF family phenazine biosynthesis protein [Sulfurimonas diazotrophicus]|uniref:PhzF family phenazine biosynthesis protein n=1 Tax=Sulfurimonas diazotrophicus TaxID=3131939 RepID=A0ABZ3H9H7_9BACT